MQFLNAEIAHQSYSN